MFSHIFAEEELSISSFFSNGAKHLKPELTFELMVKAAIQEYDTNMPADSGNYQKCDEFIFEGKKSKKSEWVKEYVGY